MLFLISRESVCGDLEIVDLNAAETRNLIIDVAVVRKPHDKWGEVPVVFAARNDDALTEENVVDMCRGRIASYKLPKEVHFVEMDDLPRSTSGKIQRHILEERLK